MTTIQQTTLTYANINIGSQSSDKAKESSGFDALLDACSSKCKDKDTQQAQGTDSLSVFINSLQQFMFNIDQSLLGIGDSDSTSAAANIAGSSSAFDADGGISVDALLNQGGPLPAFLDRVGVQYGLDDTQKEALRNIAIQFKDTDGSSAQVSQIASALKAAGIG